MRVELIYDAECPNVAETRANLLRAFAQLSLPARWTEWDRADAAAPAHVPQFGSPAILVNGIDVAGLAPNAAPCCRIYQAAAGAPSGAPSVQTIVSALKAAHDIERTGFAASIKRQLPVVPAVLFALLPKGACPACWPAYAALLSSLGLGFLARPRYLLPLTIGFLAIVLIGLAYRAPRRRGYGPLAIGAVASVLIVAGKFLVESDFLFYSGLAVLVGASLWNTWPRKTKPAPCCESTPHAAQEMSGVQPNKS